MHKVLHSSVVNRTASICMRRNIAWSCSDHERHGNLQLRCQIRQSYVHGNLHALDPKSSETILTTVQAPHIAQPCTSGLHAMIKGRAS